MAFMQRLTVTLLTAVLMCAADFVALASAQETVNDITRLNPVVVEQVVTPTTIDDVSRLIANHAGPVSIGGGRFSQGGQTACAGCLFIDMRQMNHVVALDATGKRITVEAGITWRAIQEAIDPHGLSLRIMQSYANFTVGGSLSVNAHGRYVGEGPIIRSVESFRIVMADGSLKTASRTENPEIFRAAIGGYGGLGVVVEATLRLTDNVPVETQAVRMRVEDYPQWFNATVRPSATAVFHNATLYPPEYKSVNAITIATTDRPLTVTNRLTSQGKTSGTRRALMGWLSNGLFGKQIKQHIYDPLIYSRRKVVWRNYEASLDVASIEPGSRERSTYVLQEYFIPVDRFDAFVPKMRAILKARKVNVLNLSVRQAQSDQESLLSWAPVEVFSLVLYYEQGTSDTDRQAVGVWTRELIDAAILSGGSYYLPYQIHATPEQFLKAYPRAPEYFALKRRLDPTYKFHSKLWDAYYRP